MRNLYSGVVSLDTIPGFNITAPWTQVSRIDLRPVRVCIDCKCNNINCKLVSFNKDGWEEFVSKEGFRYYWLSNRISFNMGNREEYRGISNIFRGYAFDDENYKFLKYN